MSNLPAPVHIIYASTGGNTEHVMERVAAYWQEAGITVVLHRAEQTPIEVIKDNTYFLLATSTWDEGSINPFFKKLFSEMKQENLKGKIASFIGLGDRRYEKHYFCTGMLSLKEVWEKNEGIAVGVPLMIGREPYEEIIENMVKEWSSNTLPLYLGGEQKTPEKMENQETNQQEENDNPQTTNEQATVKEPQS